VVDAFQRQTHRDQLVELEFAVEIALREERKIAPGPGAAIGGADDALLAHQRAPAEGDLLVHIDLAEKDDVAARPRELGTERKRFLMAGRFEYVIRAAAGQVLGRGDRVVLAEIDQIGRAKAPGSFQPARAEI